MILRLIILLLALTPGPARLGGEALTDRKDLKTSGARESCRQDVAGLYLSAINDLDYASGTLKAARRSLAANRKATQAARQTLATERAKYRLNPGDFRQKHTVDSAFFRLGQLERQADTLSAVIAEQSAVERKARKARRHISRSLAAVFRVRHKKNAPYSVSIRYKEPCGRFKYICPPSPAQIKAIRHLFKGQPMTVDCQKFLGHLDQP